MKLLRYGEPGHERPGLYDESGTIRDLGGVIDDVNGAHLQPASLDRIRALDPQSLPAVAGQPRLGSCVAKPSMFLCIGLNYSDHAAETGTQPPSEPIVFGKATSSVCGPYDDLIIPLGASKVDWEVELGVVIGQPVKRISEDQALNHVAGLCVINDVSEREYQLERQGQWIKGKSCDSFGPLGPYLLTIDEIANINDLKLWLEVDDERRQDGSTANMIFKVPKIISYLSHFMTLQPGDVISTGTPKGVGMGMKPPTFLKEGQTLRLGIDGLGEQCHLVVAETP